MYTGDGTQKGHWSRCTYAAFATKLERRNPGVTLTKETVDAAFRVAVQRQQKERAFKGQSGRSQGAVLESVSERVGHRRSCLV